MTQILVQPEAAHAPPPRAPYEQRDFMVLGAALGAAAVVAAVAATGLPRAQPLVGLIVIVAIGAGAWLARYGLLVLRGGQFPPVGAGVVPPAGPPTGGPARTIGMLLTITGIMVAACPLVMVAIILWLLR